MRKSKKDAIDLIATCFGVGKIPFMPGTWGSLFAVVFFLLTSHYIVLIMMLIVPVMFLGIYASDKYLAKYGIDGDPKEIVIDEFVGQIIAIIISLMFANSILSAPTTLNLQLNFTNYNPESQNNTDLAVLLSFCLFRFFDILKPFPVGWADRNIKGGKGIMYDDVLAGIMAGFSCALVFCLI